MCTTMEAFIWSMWWKVAWGQLSCVLCQLRSLMKNVWKIWCLHLFLVLPGFTLLALDLPNSAPQDLQPRPLLAMIQCFGWDEMLRPLLVTRYLNNLLQNEYVPSFFPFFLNFFPFIIFFCLFLSSFHSCPIFSLLFLSCLLSFLLSFLSCFLTFLSLLTSFLPVVLAFLPFFFLSFHSFPFFSFDLSFLTVFKTFCPSVCSSLAFFLSFFSFFTVPFLSSFLPFSFLSFHSFPVFSFFLSFLTP